MNLPFFIARRYLFSRKQKSVINVISWISLIGIAVSTMALIIVLSVYNGIGNLTQGLFNVFDPELKIEPSKGKSFHFGPSERQALQEVEGVASLSPWVEENAWVTHAQSEAIVSLRGIDSLSPLASDVAEHLYNGTFLLKGPSSSVDSETGDTVVEQTNYLVLGVDVFYQLKIHSLDITPLAIHIPKRGTSIGMTMDEAFNTAYACPAGAFMLQRELDSKYVLADISLVRGLLDYDADECSAVAVVLDGTRSMANVKADVQRLMGDDFRVLDRFEQQPLYYKVFRSERLGIILILALIVLISTLNLVASLSLLIIDKHHDIATMRSMGMPHAAIRRSFFVEGVLISAVGVVAGLLLGFIVCFLQQQFGIVKMGNNFIVSAFPVLMRGSDFLLTFLLVSALSTLAVFLTTRRSRF
ncbi:MAG: ABC transporter permease [Bacteroidales bacterium]|nr:ABC transporter permease [Bacteroidales bacterium]